MLLWIALSGNNRKTERVHRRYAGKRDRIKFCPSRHLNPTHFLNMIVLVMVM